MPTSKVLLSWQAPEFIKQQKTVVWDIGVLGITALFVMWGIWTPDITVVVLALLAGGLLWHYGLQEPKEVSFVLRGDGIQINRLFYHYKNLESYWIFHEPPHITELVIRSKRSIVPLVHINLGNTDPQQVKKALKGLLEERPEGYPLYHIMGHMIGY